MEARDSVNNGSLMFTNTVFKYQKGFNIHLQNLNIILKAWNHFCYWILDGSLNGWLLLHEELSQIIFKQLIMLRLLRTLLIPHYLKHFTNSFCLTAYHKV